MRQNGCRALHLGLLLCAWNVALASQPYLSQAQHCTVASSRHGKNLQQREWQQATLSHQASTPSTWVEQAWARITQGWPAKLNQYIQRKAEQQWKQAERGERHAEAGGVPRGHIKATSNGEKPVWPWYPGSPEQQQAARMQIERQGSSRRLLGGLPLPHSWPGFMLPERERHLGLSYAGDWGRLRAALARHKETGNLTIGVVGGSISAGAGALNSQSWVEWFEDWLGLEYNGTRDGWVAQEPIGDPRVRVANGAVPGTYSSYMSVCYNKHVPQDVDIVIVEYALNDEETLSNGINKYDNLVRRAFERLLRKLLTFPKQPAVILLNAFSWFQVDHLNRHDGMYYTGADADFSEFATYYQLPMLSVKAACWRLMQQGVPGFQVNRTRGNKAGALEPPQVDEQLRYSAFYWDIVHPNGETGHRVMSDLVVQLITHAEKSLQRRPWSETEAQRVRVRSALPEPMVKGNWESKGDRCFVGDSLHSQVLPVPEDEGCAPFVWMNDQGPGRREKWGFVANETGATIRFKIDTRTASHRRAWSDLYAALSPVGLVAVEIAHLRSYEGMGQAEVKCIKNCMCQTAIMDGLFAERKVSLVALLEVKVTMHEECILQVTALGTTSSNTTNQGTKVKITGLMISDEGAQMEESGKDLKNFGALDFVQDGLRPNKSFEIKNTWR